jgi:hypothetical protein
VLEIADRVLDLGAPAVVGLEGEQVADPVGES